MKKWALMILIHVLFAGNLKAQLLYPTCYVDLADSSIRLNICMDALIRTNRRIYTTSDLERRFNQLAIDTLAYRGFRNARFYKVRLFNRNDLESALYASTLDTSRLPEYYSHPERRIQHVIDSTLRSVFRITTDTSNTKLAALAEARHCTIRHDVLYYLANLECGRIWCAKLNGKVLPPDAKLTADFFNGVLLDFEAQYILRKQPRTSKRRSQLSKELREYLYVEELGTEFLQTAEK